MNQYNSNRIEKKWAKKWIEEKTFSVNLEKADNPYYALFMFPYPSAEGLHIGNFYAFTCVDVMAKYKRLKGFDSFEPMGFDAFGIHSENYALKIKEAPKEMLKRTTENFKNQIVNAGLGCDWDALVDTTTPEYYKWTQWIFTKLFKKGLAFQKEALLSWCPSCKTVLADEQIEDGFCERCKTAPEKKNMKQWFFKITDYAERLLNGLGEMDWSEITKSAQRNWIGRSEGTEVNFTINGNNVPIFTTRADTLFGCTYFVLSPEHPLVLKIVTPEKKSEVEKYIKKTASKSELDRIEAKEKTGVFTGSYAINPINNEKVPVWIADYVLMGYGTGAIMAVPAHDERDLEFAKKYKIEVREVVANNEDFTGEGEMINSGNYNGMYSSKARESITSWLEKNNLGKRKVNYRLRDWCISRQRYWGPPIPVVYCDDCGIVPVEEENLPVLLPDLDKNWEPAGDGKGPLSNVNDFMKVKCPKCGKEGKREADVMDNFLDSSWYFFRYLSSKNEKEIFDQKLVKKWMPIDLYIGGNEHAVLHLMYTRFITMVFHDLGIIDFDNPFKKFRANGMILNEGKKMSKSKGNVINPEEYGKKVGYDALKTYLMFLGPLADDKSFSDKGILGAKRWIEKVDRLEEKVFDKYQDEKEVIQKLNITIKEIEEDLEGQKYNTAVARLMELTNVLSQSIKISKDVWQKFLPLIAPFAPAIAEEMWEKSGKNESIFKNKNWPEIDNKALKEDTVNLVIQINGKMREIMVTETGKDEENLKEEVLENEKIKKWIGCKEIKKIIIIKDKLINIVL
jgi:leucyl-tRNA synthetase